MHHVTKTVARTPRKNKVIRVSLEEQDRETTRLNWRRLVLTRTLRVLLENCRWGLNTVIVKTTVIIIICSFFFFSFFFEIGKNTFYSCNIYSVLRIRFD